MINRDAYIGQQIGNYRLVEKIACGSFGCVYRAEHTRLKNRTVAIKLLNAPLASQQQHDSFMQEADLMVMLTRDNIPVIDAPATKKELQPASKEEIQVESFVHPKKKRRTQASLKQVQASTSKGASNEEGRKEVG